MTNQLMKFEKQGCTPCAMLQNFLDDKGVQVSKINAFEQPDQAAKFDIGSLPTLVLVDEEGNEIDRHVGFKPSETERVEALIAQL